MLQFIVHKPINQTNKQIKEQINPTKHIKHATAFIWQFIVLNTPISNNNNEKYYLFVR